MNTDENIDYTVLSDEDLVGYALEDVNVFGIIVERYEKRLLRYIHRISAFSEEGAQDILQEVFIKAWKNLNGFSPRLKFSSWIYRITHNFVIDTFRKSKSRGDNEQVELTEELSLPSKDISEFDFDAELSAKNMAKVLQAMPEKYQTLLILHFLEEKDYLEISDILKLPKGTIASRMSRAKEKFKKVAQTLSIQF